MPDAVIPAFALKIIPFTVNPVFAVINPLAYIVVAVIAPVECKLAAVIAPLVIPDVVIPAFAVSIPFVYKFIAVNSPHDMAPVITILSPTCAKIVLFASS